MEFARQSMVIFLQEKSSDRNSTNLNTVPKKPRRISPPRRRDAERKTESNHGICAAIDGDFSAREELRSEFNEFEYGAEEASEDFTAEAPRRGAENGIKSWNLRGNRW